MDITSNIDDVLDLQTPQSTQPNNIITLKSSPFTNGTHKRHLTTTTPPQQPPSMVVVSYKECLKNHAASLGGHALDGCGEFMPSILTHLNDPRSLKCAACGCHRNFHRRDPQENITTTTAATTTTTNNNNFLNCIYTAPTSMVPPAQPPPPLQLPHRGPISQSSSPSQTTSPSHSPSPISSPSSPPPLSHFPPYHSSAPHMLLALGNSYSTPLPPPPSQSENRDQQQNHHRNLNFSTSIVKLENNINNTNKTSSGNKKRHRTKFSKEQKEKMHVLSEKLGWKLQKGDDEMVQKLCNEIGVSRGVFKVWMHNNKNNSLRKKSESDRLGIAANKHQSGNRDNDDKPISFNNNDNIHMNQDNNSVNVVHVSYANGLSSS